MNIKLIIQRVNKQKNNRIIIIKRKCDNFIMNRTKVEITENNINSLFLINEKLKIGDIMISPLESISFIKNNIEEEKIDVLGDPYYKLYKKIYGIWILIDKWNTTIWK